MTDADKIIDISTSRGYLLAGITTSPVWWLTDTLAPDFALAVYAQEALVLKLSNRPSG